MGTLKNWFRSKILRRSQKPSTNPVLHVNSNKTSTWVNKQGRVTETRPIMDKYVLFPFPSNGYEFISGDPHAIKLNDGSLADSILYSPPTLASSAGMDDDLNAVYARYLGTHRNDRFKIYKFNPESGNFALTHVYPQGSMEEKTRVLIASLNPYYYLHYTPESEVDLERVNRCLARLLGPGASKLRVIPVFGLSDGPLDKLKELDSLLPPVSGNGNNRRPDAADILGKNPSPIYAFMCRLNGVDGIRVMYCNYDPVRNPKCASNTQEPICEFVKKIRNGDLPQVRYLIGLDNTRRAGMVAGITCGN